MRRKTPSERLKAVRQVDAALAAHTAGSVQPLVPPRRPHKVRTKWRVTENIAVPEFHNGALREVYHVTLVAVFEGKPLHGGLAYVQGCPDNLAFGDEEPKAEQRLRFVSKAVADIYRFGAVFVQDHAEFLPSA